MNQKILPIAFKRCTVDVQYQLVCNFSSFPWCFEWSVVRHLGIQTPTNMSNRKRKEGEMKMLTGARCTASEQSWQTALVSPFFSFFLAHDWNKSRGPRWVGRRMCRCCSRFFDFPPAFAESSWQWGRPALFPRSTCDGQLQISHLISLSVYFCLTPFLSHIGIFLTTFSLSLPSPSFVFRFDLHEERTTFLSAQAAFLPVKKGWVRAAPSVSRIITGFCFFFFFVIPAEYEESQKTKFTERHCAIRGWGQIQCVPYRLKVLPQATLLWSISIDVSHGSSIAEWWDPVQGVSCSAFFSFFFFLLLLESGCG